EDLGGGGARDRPRLRLARAVAGPDSGYGLRRGPSRRDDQRERVPAGVVDGGRRARSAGLSRNRASARSSPGGLRGPDEAALDPAPRRRSWHESRYTIGPDTSTVFANGFRRAIAPYYGMTINSRCAMARQLMRPYRLYVNCTAWNRLTSKLSIVDCSRNRASARSPGDSLPGLTRQADTTTEAIMRHID